jgi:small subunit ribosomal protein S21
MKIEVRNGNVEKALRVMKKKLKNSGMMLELKERMYYSKPSEKKREAKKRGIKDKPNFVENVNKICKEYI